MWLNKLQYDVEGLQNVATAIYVEFKNSYQGTRRDAHEEVQCVHSRAVEELCLCTSMYALKLGELGNVTSEP